MVLPVHQLTPYLRVWITTDDRSITISHRRGLFGLVPLWVARIDLPLPELAAADVRGRVRAQCLATAAAIIVAIFLFDLPLIAGIALGIVAAFEVLLAFAPGKAIHVVRRDSRSWTVPFCRRYAFDAELALEDALQRRDADQPRSGQGAMSTSLPSASASVHHSGAFASLTM